MYYADTDSTFYTNVLNIPEQQVNDYRIIHQTHKAGTVLSTSNMRTMIMGGQQREEVTLEEDTIFHQLEYDGGTWMTDLPIEQAQHDRELRGAHGRVLVGGLGLGYAVTLLSQISSVDEIVVVEKSPEVIEMVWPHTKTFGDGNIVKASVIQADLMEVVKSPSTFLPNRGDWFDVAFYDIWQHDGEGTFHDVVVPLLKHSASFVGHVVNWNEDVMRGQLYMGLLSRTHFALIGSPNGNELEQAFAEKVKKSGVPDWKQLTEYVADSDYHNWSVPFFRSLQANKLDGITLEELESSMGSFNMPEALNEAAGKYAAWYGVPDRELDLSNLLGGFNV